MSGKRLLRIFAFLALGTLLAGLIVPSFKADRYRSRIQSALSSAMGREVTIGDVRFNLLTGPGFTVTDVVIEEDPALGFEPVAYAKTVIATPRFLSLLTGHLAFSSLRLEDAHLNLARADLPGGEYRWNFEPLLRPALIAAFPNLVIRGARINFKAANVKSVVYLLESDLLIEPPSRPGSSWHFRFEGKPARTDRPARGSGLVRARGEWKPGLLDAQLQLERSELGDLIAIIRGEDAGLHGSISGSAHFKGPLDGVAILGSLRIEEPHGWDQDIPKGESWPLDLHGRWNSPAQQLELDASIVTKQNTPLAVHYLVDQYLTQPRWGASVTMARFPAAPLVPLARHLGLPLSPGLEVNGTLDGVVGFSVLSGYGGQMRITESTVKLPGTPALRIGEAHAVIAGDTVKLEPARVLADEGQEAIVDGSYSLSSGGRFRIAATNLDVLALTRQLPSGAVPVLSEARSGTWTGSLEWSGDSWVGDLSLAHVTLAPPALSAPLVLESAQCHVEAGSIAMQKITGHTGAVELAGDYRYQPFAAHPHRFRIAAGPVEAAHLEELLLPALRRSRGVLGVNLGVNLGVDLPFRNRALPAWLAQWHAEGTLQFATLKTELGAIDNLHARVLWDAGRVSLRDMQWRNVTAQTEVDLRGPEPKYQVSARLRDFEWKGGSISAEADATLRGTGAALLRSLEAQGAFSVTGAEEAVDRLTGRYTLAWRTPVPRVALTAVRLVSANDTYTGKGRLQDDGTVLLQLTSAARQARLTGPLISDGPFRWTSP